MAAVRRGFNFSIPNLPKDVYLYLKVVRGAQQLSPWQVVILALRALEYMGTHHQGEVLELVERVKRDHVKP